MTHIFSDILINMMIYDIYQLMSLNDMRLTLHGDRNIGLLWFDDLLSTCCWCKLPRPGKIEIRYVTSSHYGKSHWHPIEINQVLDLLQFHFLGPVLLLEFHKTTSCVAVKSEMIRENSRFWPHVMGSSQSMLTVPSILHLPARRGTRNRSPLNSSQKPILNIIKTL